MATFKIVNNYLPDKFIPAIYALRAVNDMVTVISEEEVVK